MLDPKRVRNVAIIAHDGAGKTALTEALLRHNAPSRASTDGSTSRLDADPEETKRNFTVATHITFAEHEGVLLNLLDTAGFSDFLTDADRSMAVSEGGLLLVSAVSGVKRQTERQWQMAAERSLPLLACVNKLDGGRASFLRALDDLEKALGATPIALQLPIGLGSSFTGVVDLVSMRAHVYARRADGKFGGFIDEDIPPELLAEARRLRARLIEAVAETDDLLLEKYLDGQEPGEDRLRSAIAHAVLGRRFLPVVACAARPGVGVRDVAQAMVDYLPSPLSRRSVVGVGMVGTPTVGAPIIERAARSEAPVTILAFRNTVSDDSGRMTAFRVFAGTLKPGMQVVNSRSGHLETIEKIFHIDGSRTIEAAQAGAGEIVAVLDLKDVHVGDVLSDPSAPISFDLLGRPRRTLAYALKIDRGEEERVRGALRKLLEEDPSLELVHDIETGETLLKGMGQVHVEVAVEKLKRKFNADVHPELPLPAYHETIATPSQGRGRYKKTVHGRLQFGEVILQLTPLPRGAGIQIADSMPMGLVPKSFVRAIEAGIKDAALHGPLGRFPVVDVQVRIAGGAFHTVDSSDHAFRGAAMMALKSALARARSILLEPIMRLEVVVPDALIGVTISDLTARRGRIMGMEPSSKGTLIYARAPQSELRTYAAELRELSKGAAYFTMEVAAYDEVPTHEAHRVLSSRKTEQGKDLLRVNQPIGRA
jgi:elongation factor G